MGHAVALGDIVLYQPSGSNHQRPAIVTHVWGETCVNLYIFQDGGHPDEPINGQHISVALGDGACEWLPKPE